jgi:cytochrome c5
MSLFYRCLFCLLFLVLAACTDDQQATVQTAGPTTPADPQVAALYNRSCRSCHAQGAAQAPLTGNREAWAPRLEQGMEILLDHTISGYKGMPPMGMCFDCDEEQFTALIRFMSGTED